jgi:predicted transcriptional regulator
MSVEISSELEERLQEIALTVHRSASELAEEVIQNFVTYLEGLAAAVKEGDASASHDGLLTSKQVLTRISSR